MNTSWNGPVTQTWSGTSNGVMYNPIYTSVAPVGHIPVMPQNAMSQSSMPV